MEPPSGGKSLHFSLPELLTALGAMFAGMRGWSAWRRKLAEEKLKRAEEREQSIIGYWQQEIETIRAREAVKDARIFELTQEVAGIAKHSAVRDEKLRHTEQQLEEERRRRQEETEALRAGLAGLEERNRILVSTNATQAHTMEEWATVAREMFPARKDGERP